MTNITDKIDKFLEFFTTITREEANNIEEIIKWDSETKAAFLLAKRTFESDNNLDAPTDTCEGTENLKNDHMPQQHILGHKRKLESLT